MIPVSVDIDALFVTQYFIIFFDYHPNPKLRVYKKCTPDVAFFVIFLGIVFDQYVGGV